MNNLAVEIQNVKPVLNMDRNVTYLFYVVSINAIAKMVMPESLLMENVSR
jgi:hypothetical protein